MRLIRRGILGSVVVGAVLAIVALLGGDFGVVHAKTIGTALSIAGGGILLVAAISARERSLFGPLWVFGASSAVAGTGLLVAGIWIEPGADAYWKTLGTLLIVAVGVATAALIAFAVLAPRHRWLGAATYRLIAALSLYAVALVWTEWDAQWAWRIFGVIAVLLSASAVAVLVLHETAVSPGAGPPPALPKVGFCPFCGRALAPATGVTTCGACDAAFVVTTPPEALTSR